MSLTTEIKTLLTTVSNVYIGDMPDSPDNVVAIYTTGGYPRDLSGTYVKEPTFMVMVRNTSFAAGEALCSTINNLLHGQSTTSVLMIENQSDPLGLGKDEKNRSKWSMNFRCYYRE